MSDDPDRYEAWYAEKLWGLLPALYRIEDSPELGGKGPLQELVERIGVQAAVVRRSIDRLWEDQSIETCDDWVINYLGDLLGTNIVASLDARGRRLDVAKTINYRRRKGTVGLLEELATDITGWKVRVVEFFHRLARTRHGLDPAVGFAAPAATSRGRLQRGQGLVGLHTGTCAGGWADLRNVYGARLAHTAFDEFAHTADVRRGRGQTGWHGIPHLGVFVWRLKSWPLEQVTPVKHATCADWYSFDPTGRDAPLFAAGHAPVAEQWVSPSEQQLPGEITPELLEHALADLYTPVPPPSVKARSLAVYRFSLGEYLRIPAQDFVLGKGGLLIDPKHGRFSHNGGPFRVDYHYGFSSDIGAGPYNRQLPGAAAAALPSPVLRVSDATPLPDQLKNLRPPQSTQSAGTVVIDDSLTYDAIVDVDEIHNVTLRAENLCRPLIRPTPTSSGTWVFTGKGDARLTLDGLFVSGVEIVLRGRFEQVTLSCCTLDPGSWDETQSPKWAEAVDGRQLTAARLRIEGHVGSLTIDRCIVGPIEEQPSDDGKQGLVERLTIRDSIVQAAHPNAPAITVASGEVALSRCTVLGTAQIHRLDASECILHDVVTVEDRQHGCVRFSAWATGSLLPRKYESVAIAVRAGLFASRVFGRPDYAQLLASAGAGIAEGAEDGSEMGAFAREKNAIKERSLLIKYQEYLPLGLEPVIVHVT